MADGDGGEKSRPRDEPPHDIAVPGLPMETADRIIETEKEQEISGGAAKDVNTKDGEVAADAPPAQQGGLGVFFVRDALISSPLAALFRASLLSASLSALPSSALPSFSSQDTKSFLNHQHPTYSPDPSTPRL